MMLATDAQAPHMPRQTLSNDDLLIQAAKAGDARALQGALDLGADPKAGDSEALGWACFHGHSECSRMLLPLSDPSARDFGALQWAAMNGHAECVRLLLPVSDPMADGSRALILAAHLANPQCVALLLPVSDLSATNEKGMNAAAIARALGQEANAEMIEAFVEARALAQSVPVKTSSQRPMPRL